MEKLTDNEIKKALVDYKNSKIIQTENGVISIGDILDLINRLQAKVIKEQNKNSKLRNERNHLQADLDSLIQNDLPRCKDALRRANEMGMELQAENERLKNSLAISKKETKRFQGSYKTAKAEAYKECIEKVKERSSKMELVCSGALVRTDYTIAKESLDNLLKELVGEDDGKL